MAHLNLLMDAFTPETNKILNAYVGMDTKDGPAVPFPNFLNEPANDRAVTDALVGRSTFDQ